MLNWNLFSSPIEKINTQYKKYLNYMKFELKTRIKKSKNQKSTNKLKQNSQNIRARTCPRHLIYLWPESYLIVAYTTSKLGLGGTIISAVLGSMLYQFMSHFIREPLGKVKTQKIELSIVFVLPLLLILGIELIYFMAPLYWQSEKIFYLLEGATGWNLFRTIGIGLIIMGIYPILQSEFIKTQ